MLILDRYIVGRYLERLLWALVAAAVVFLAVDLVEQLDKFIDARVPSVTVIRYYMLYLPYIIYLILPVATLLATLFTVGGMAQSNELAAMQVSGVPFTRPLSLLVLTAAVIAGGGFLIGETLVPETNRRRMDIYRYEVKRLPRESRARHGKLYLQVDRGRQMFIGRYEPATREAYGVEMVKVQGGRLAKRWDAEKMVWLDGQWRMQGVQERTFRPDGTVSYLRDVKFQVSGPGLSPGEFERVQTHPEEMNWWELNDFIQRLRAAGGAVLRWEVDLLFKVSLPVAAVIIVLFGAPIAAVKRRSGTALGFGLSLFVCFIYFGFIQVGKVLGYNGTLPPLVSAWAGNVFFGALGLGILWRWGR